MTFFLSALRQHKRLLILGGILLVVVIAFLAPRVFEPSPIPEQPIIDITDNSATITVSREHIFRLKDKKTQIAFTVGEIYSKRWKHLERCNGWICVKVGDVWTELVNEMILYNAPYKMKLTKGTCTWGQILVADTIKPTLTECVVNVETQEERIPTTQPQEITETFHIEEFDGEKGRKVLTKQYGDYFISLRVFSSDIDTAYRQRPGVSTRIDMITPFGVSNVPIRAAEQGSINTGAAGGSFNHVVIGPQQIQYQFVTVLDHSYNIQLRIENTDEQSQNPRIMLYK